MRALFNTARTLNPFIVRILHKALVARFSIQRANKKKLVCRNNLAPRTRVQIEVHLHSVGARVASEKIYIERAMRFKYEEAARMDIMSKT